MLKKILDGFFLLRIPLLAPVWTIFLVGWITGNSNACPGGFFVNADLLKSTSDAWIILGGFSLAVASIYVVNQIADIESDRINHKLFILPNGFISVKTAWVLSAFCAISGLIIASLFGKIFLTLFIISLILGQLYNLPPASLKNHAFGGLIANVLGHGMVTYLVGWFSAYVNTPITIEMFRTAVISSFAQALANGAVYLATTVPDADGDRSTGKQTFSVKYGEKATAIFSAIMCAGALITSFLMNYNAWVMIIPTAISVVFFSYFAFTTKKEIAFKAFKWPVFLLSASVVLFQPEYGLLILLTFFGSRLYYKWRFNFDYPTFKSK